MKSYSPFYRSVYPYSWAVERFGYVSLTITSLILGVDKNSAWLEDRPIVLRAIVFTEDHALWFFSIFVACIMLGLIFRRLGNPWVWDKLKFILDEYQGKAFNVNPSDPQDHHRVTLFKEHSRCILRRHWSSSSAWKPWGNTPVISRYLVPVLRSGHISQKSSALFHIPDDSDKSEGVAGKAWSANEAIIISDLPDVNRPRPGVRDRRKYAESTNSTVEMVDSYIGKGRQLPRSIAAIPIEVDGKPWGVVVLDSRSPNGVQQQSVLDYTLTVALLGQLLEEA